MNIAVQTQVKTSYMPIPSFTHSNTGLLQGKYTCDESGKRKKPLTLQRSPMSNNDSSTVPPIMHEVLRSPGQPLDPATRAFMEPQFGHDFSKVRVHTDTRAVESVKSYNTRAYTVGNHVVFGLGQYAPKTSEGQELLFHELIHVAQNLGDNNSINFWSKEEHHQLTKQMVDFYRYNPHSPSIMHDPLFGGEQFYRIIDSAFDMDVTAKRILWTGPKFVLGITKGEGPEHGEDGNYSELNINKARPQNIKLQEDYVDKALKFYRKEITPEIKQVDKNRVQVTPPVRRFFEGRIQLTPNVKTIFKALGDACHIAQDRGAHWEGTKGKGHDDPRARGGTWDPDNPKDNAEGHKIAQKNTYDVFRMWAWETTMSTGYEGK